MSEIRTPPSLKWLITVRARLLGDLARQNAQHPLDITAIEHELTLAKQAVANVQRCLTNAEKRHSELQADLSLKLNAIETALSIHPVRIDPALIRPVLSHISGRKSSYGVITRGLYAALRRAEGKPLTTSQMTASIVSDNDLLFDDNAEFIDFRDRVRRRLKNLCLEGKIKRIDPDKKIADGRWGLVE